MRKIPLTCWIADVCQVYKLDSLDNCTGASPVYCQYYCIYDIAVGSYTIPQLIKAQIPIFVGIENARTRAKTKIGNSTKAKSQMADQAKQNKISAKVTHLYHEIYLQPWTYPKICIRFLPRQSPGISSSHNFCTGLHSTIARTAAITLTIKLLPARNHRVNVRYREIPPWICSRKATMASFPIPIAISAKNWLSQPYSNA